MTSIVLLLTLIAVNAVLAICNAVILYKLRRLNDEARRNVAQSQAVLERAARLELAWNSLEG